MTSKLIINAAIGLALSQASDLPFEANSPLSSIIDGMVFPTHLSPAKVDEINSEGGLDLKSGEMIELTIELLSPDSYWEVDMTDANDAFTYDERFFSMGSKFQEFKVYASDYAASGLFLLRSYNGAGEVEDHEDVSFAINVHGSDEIEGDHECEFFDIIEL